MPSTKKLKTDKLELKARLREIIKKYAILLGIGLAYLIFVLITGFGIPCIFHLITGLQCPGCGISRMFVSLAKLDFVSAFKYNSFVFITGPFLLAYVIANEIKYIVTGNNKMGKWEIFLWVESALAIAFGVLRNIFPL